MSLAARLRLLLAALAFAGCSGMGEPGDPAVSQSAASPKDAAPLFLARWPGFPLLPDGRFPIAGWCAPPVRETSDARFAEYADAGFTVVLPALEDPYQPRSNLERLDVAGRHALFVIVRDNRVHPGEAFKPGWRARVDSVVAAHSGHPALLGYMLADEPIPESFPSLAALTRRFAAQDPRHPTYVNLFGGSEGSYQGLTFAQYVRRFRDLARPSFFSFDKYALEEGGDDPSFFGSFEIVRREAGPVPFWAILQLTPHAHYRELTEAELSWQANLALAYGARGIVWFTYWTPNPDEALRYRGGPIAYDGHRNPSYDEVARVNRRIAALGRELSPLVLVAVRHSGGLPPGGQALEPGGAFRVEGGDLTVGFFRGAAAHYALVVNRDHDRPVRCRVSFAASAGRAEQWSGQPSVYQRLPSGPRVLDLEPGAAALFRTRRRLP